jgi:cell division protein FtsL
LLESGIEQVVARKSTGEQPMTGEDNINDVYDAPGAPEPAKPLQMARIRRQLASSFFHLGPLQLGLIAAILISVLALLYLNEVGLAAQARLRLQQLAIQQTQLQQQNQQLLEQQGVLKSPAYVEKAARHLGMVPEDPSKVHVIVIPG